jgi:hypothetical protein
MPIIQKNGENKITGFNCFRAEGSPIFYEKVTDFLGTRYEEIQLLNILEAEEIINRARQVPTFWNINPPLEEDALYELDLALPQIELDEYVKMVNVFQHFAESGLGAKEVACFILFDPILQRVFFVFPEQVVTSASVNWTNVNVKKGSDTDGNVKLMSEWLSENNFVGYCHSHNTMPLSTPSGGDDHQEVLNRPVGVHILLSTFTREPSWKVTVTASINNSRLYLDPEEIIPSVTTDEYIEHEGISDYAFNTIIGLVNIPRPVFNNAWLGKNLGGVYSNYLPSTPAQYPPKPALVPNSAPVSQGGSHSSSLYFSKEAEFGYLEDSFTYIIGQLGGTKDEIIEIIDRVIEQKDKYSVKRSDFTKTSFDEDVFGGPFDVGDDDFFTPDEFNPEWDLPPAQQAQIIEEDDRCPS